MQIILQENNNSYVDDLKRAIRDLADTITSHYPHLQLFSDSEQNKRTFELYSSYPNAQKKRIYDDVTKYKNITNSIFNSDQRISNQSALWVALKMFGHPNSADDLFSYIEESDVIEIYRYDGIQVFRNLNFHDVCSYELPELFIYPWDQLFYRHESISAKIAQGVMTVFSGQHDGILNIQPIVDEHYNCETFSPKRYKLKMNFKYFYPLRNKQNQVEYAIALSKVHIEQLYFNYKELITIPPLITI